MKKKNIFSQMMFLKSKKGWNLAVLLYAMHLKSKRPSTFTGIE